MKVENPTWLNDSIILSKELKDELPQWAGGTGKLIKEFSTLKKILLARKDSIELAILANGGAEHKKEWCECDPECNNCPCQYCAIHEGLKNILKVIDMVG